MTTNDDRQKQRERLNTIAQSIIDRAREMFKDDNIPLDTALRLCIAWELEAQISAAFTSGIVGALKLAEPRVPVETAKEELVRANLTLEAIRETYNHILMLIEGLDDGSASLHALRGNVLALIATLKP